MALSASASLKLDKVLNLTLKQLSLRLAPLLSFSSVCQAKELPRGDGNKLQVPFIPLENMASQDWNPATGYGNGSFNIESREVPVNRRKYQALTFTSEQLIGLPVDALALGMQQKADRLALDIIQDVMGQITLANFGAAIHESEPAAFYSDDIADIAVKLDESHWPEVGRNLLLHTSFTGNLRKEDDLKNVDRAGNDQVLRHGVIGRVQGMDVIPVVGLPDNGQRLKGFAALQYGILIANAPVEPAMEVKSALSDYRIYTDPSTGLTMVYRAWGDANMDSGKRVIEVCYGSAVGDSAQIKRITLPDPEVDPDPDPEEED